MEGEERYIRLDGIALLPSSSLCLLLESLQPFAMGSFRLATSRFRNAFDHLDSFQIQRPGLVFLLMNDSKPLVNLVFVDELQLGGKDLGCSNLERILVLDR